MNEKEDRFRFGENWQSYSQLIDEQRIAEAQRRLAEAVGSTDLSGKRLLDIGCGSGLHSLAALRLGVRNLLAVDLDPQSVDATRRTVALYNEKAEITVREQSVFDLDAQREGTFDIVYSWGVLHHTGDMNRAIVSASRMVAPGGKLVVALYGRTPYCGIWTKIKRWYVNASPERKEWAERMYIRLFGAYLMLRGKRLSKHMENYSAKRGMDFRHDVKDWIGGYPYESIRPSELDALVLPHGFVPEWRNVRRRSGLFGSGNDEYRYRKV